ncbi:MAG: DUF1614 domain-containing protein [Candidatus Omnitrophica bacterium]|nr:DUF1614 domain-containing protein [Candidatus Omnitrophota bacterium]
MMIFIPFSLLLFFLLLLFLPFFFFLVQIEIFRLALSKIGLSPTVAFFIILVSLLGSAVNIPLVVKEVNTWRPLPPEIFSLLVPFRMPQMSQQQVIAINLGGAIIPLLLCLYLLPRAPSLPTFFATVISSLVCFHLSRVVPGMGVTIPAFIPPLVAVFLAFIFSPGNKIPVAYISGVLGVLIGADLLNLPHLGNYPGVMSIGGAGVYDGIFLVGIISALLA